MANTELTPPPPPLPHTRTLPHFPCSLYIFVFKVLDRVFFPLVGSFQRSSASQQIFTDIFLICKAKCKSTVVGGKKSVYKFQNGRVTQLKLNNCKKSVF